MAVTDMHPTLGRDRILHEAASLFLTHGYAETSMRVIADAVDIRPASIYHHFASKDALLSEILTIGMKAVTDAFEQAASSSVEGRARVTAEDKRRRLERHVAGHLRALFAHHGFTAAHVTVFPFAPESVRRAAVSERDAYEAQWSRLLAEIAPRLSNDERRLVRLALFGAMNSAVQWFDASEGSVDDLAQTIVRTLWLGLSSESEPTPESQR